MTVEFVSKQEKEKIIEKLKEQYGIERLPFLLVKSGKEKVRCFNGILSKEEISKLSREVRVETIGLYFAALHEDGIRISLDAAHILNEQISKNIIEVNDEKADEWFKGNDAEIDNKEEKKGFVIVRNNQDIIGIGKCSGKNIKNFLPKERRVKC